jgi:flagellar biogenesis protein FliO
MAEIRLFFAVCLLFLCSFPAFAAEVKSELAESSVRFSIQFEKGYSDVNVIKLDKSYIISFQTAEEVVYSEEFWDSPVSQAYIHSEGDRKKLIVDFATAADEPKIETAEKSVVASFSFAPAPEAPSAVGTGAYVRMITGLGFVIIIILVIYWFTRRMLSRRVLSELPGSGRLLGKVDLEIRKSLFFYELVDAVYIFGVTDMSVNLIEKVTDEAEVNRIKSGFARKGEFGSYLNFFAKGSDVKTDIEASRNIIRERLKSIKKR